MNQKEYSLNDQNNEFLSKSIDGLILLQKNMQSTINTFVDKGQISLTMNNMQIIQSLTISEKLLLASDKTIIRDRLLRLINEAILSSSINGANAAKNTISYQEYNEIISNEDHEKAENIEVIRKNIAQMYKIISSIRKTVDSKSGKISVVMSGASVIKTLSISDEYLSPKNKEIIETELLETVNRAIREIREEIQQLAGC